MDFQLAIMNGKDELRGRSLRWAAATTVDLNKPSPSPSLAKGEATVRA